MVNTQNSRPHGFYESGNAGDIRKQLMMFFWLKLLVLSPFLWLELQQSVKHWANQLGQN